MHNKDFFLVPKMQLVDSIVTTFRGFGLLDAFGMDARALEGFVREVCQLVGAYPYPYAYPPPPAPCTLYYPNVVQQKTPHP